MVYLSEDSFIERDGISLYQGVVVKTEQMENLTYGNYGLELKHFVI